MSNIQYIPLYFYQAVINLLKQLLIVTYLIKYHLKLPNSLEVNERICEKAFWLVKRLYSRYPYISYRPFGVNTFCKSLHDTYHSYKILLYLMKLEW